MCILCDIKTLADLREMVDGAKYAHMAAQVFQTLPDEYKPEAAQEMLNMMGDHMKGMNVANIIARAKLIAEAPQPIAIIGDGHVVGVSFFGPSDEHIWVGPEMSEGLRRRIAKKFGLKMAATYNEEAPADPAAAAQANAQVDEFLNSFTGTKH